MPVPTVNPAPQPPNRSQRLCSVKGCDRPHYGRGFCELHWTRQHRNGDPLKLVYTPRGEAARWLESVALNWTGDGCLVWPYRRDAKGYGTIRWHGRGDRVHRVVCTLIHGAPPSPEHEVGHLCGNGAAGCVNPRHLRWCTPVENAADKKRRREAIRRAAA